MRCFSEFVGKTSVLAAAARYLTTCVGEELLQTQAARYNPDLLKLLHTHCVWLSELNVDNNSMSGWRKGVAASFEVLRQRSSR